MSFWGGFVRGVESNRAERELKEKRDSDSERLGVMDRRYEDQLKRSNEQWNNTLNQQKIQRDRLDAQDKLKADKLLIDRTVQLNLGSDTPTGAPTGTSKRANAKVLAMAQAPAEVRALLGGDDGFKELTVDNQKYFQQAIDNPGFALFLTDFIKSQEKDHNNLIQMRDMPTWIGIAAAVEAQGEEGFKAFEQGVADGTYDLANAEDFIKGIQAAKANIPGYIIPEQKKVFKSTEEHKQDFELWAFTTLSIARQ